MTSTDFAFTVCDCSQLTIQKDQIWKFWYSDILLQATPTETKQHLRRATPVDKDLKEKAVAEAQRRSQSRENSQTRKRSQSREKSETRKRSKSRERSSSKGPKSPKPCRKQEPLGNLDDSLFESNDDKSKKRKKTVQFGSSITCNGNAAVHVPPPPILVHDYVYDYYILEQVGIIRSISTFILSLSTVYVFEVSDCF